MTDFDLENPKPFILTCKDRKVKTEEDMCVHLTVEEAKQLRNYLNNFIE